jgi:hypothetical protein
MDTGFLLGELDAIEAKLRKRLLAEHSDPDDSEKSGKNRRMIDYHSLQTQVVWGLMKATAGELQSILHHHSLERRQSGQGNPGSDLRKGSLPHAREEHEILAELSKRWDIWRRQYENVFA